MNKYEVILYWSKQHDAFVAELPQLTGYAVHEDSPAEALRNSQEAIALWIETARDCGDPISTPAGRRLVFS